MGHNRTRHSPQVGCPKVTALVRDPYLKKYLRVFCQAVGPPISLRHRCSGGEEQQKHHERLLAHPAPQRLFYHEGCCRLSRDAPRDLMEPAIRQVRANGQSRQCSLFSQAESSASSASISARNSRSQIPIAQPRPGLPSFRQQGEYNAYSEGWCFTQRAWAKVTGFDQDPYSDYGRLSSEPLCAVRLGLSIQVFTTSAGLANR